MKWESDVGIVVIYLDVGPGKSPTLLGRYMIGTQNHQPAGRGVAEIDPHGSLTAVGRTSPLPSEERPKSRQPLAASSSASPLLLPLLLL